MRSYAHTWKTAPTFFARLTFPTIDDDKNENMKELSNVPELAAEVLGLLDRFADQVIELGEPIWQIQKEALATPPKIRRGQ